MFLAVESDGFPFSRKYDAYLYIAKTKTQHMDAKVQRQDIFIHITISSLFSLSQPSSLYSLRLFFIIKTLLSWKN